MTTTDAKPTLREQLTPHLPAHTAWTSGLLFQESASWTTPAGLWRISQRAFSPLDVTGPSFQLTGRSIAHTLGVLRALGAIEAEPTYTGAEVAAAVMHVAEGTIGPVAYLPDSCGICDRATTFFRQVTAGAAPTVAAAGVVPMPTLAPDAEAQQHTDAVTTEPTCRRWRTRNGNEWIDSTPGSATVQAIDPHTGHRFGAHWGRALIAADYGLTDITAEPNADTAQEPARA